MLNMEGAELAEKVKTQLSTVEDQVRFEAGRLYLC
jgi:hypothetical protein